MARVEDKWTEEQIERLVRATARYGNWRQVGRYVGRTAKQCSDKGYAIGLSLKMKGALPELTRAEKRRMKYMSETGKDINEVSSSLSLPVPVVVRLALKMNLKFKPPSGKDTMPTIIDDSALATLAPPKSYKVSKERAAGVDWALGDSYGRTQKRTREPVEV